MCFLSYVRAMGLIASVLLVLISLTVLQGEVGRVSYMEIY